MINAFQRVNPSDQRNQKKDQRHKEDQADKVELTEEGDTPESEVELLLEIEQPDNPEDGHLDIAV